MARLYALAWQNATSFRAATLFGIIGGTPDCLSEEARPPVTHIALLRGINVGGKASLPMQALRGFFAEAGASDVRTYIQSGNVVFRSEEAGAVVEQVTAQIAAMYGYPGRIVHRAEAEWRAAWRGNPFAGALPASLHVYFLVDRPEPRAIKALDPDRSPGDSFVISGREVYLHLPSGMARTRLTNAYFDKALTTTSTARNWNTVGKLVEMMDG